MTMTLDDAEAAFRAFVLDARFPCLAGKGVVNTHGHTLGIFGELGSRRSARRLARALHRFLDAERGAAPSMRAYVAVFAATPACDELEFEKRLWEQLERLDASQDSGQPWASGVSDDPADPTFSFSFAGQALFVIGLHPNSSRIARRFAWPALVFNAHEQFDQLRSGNQFERLRSQVRVREMALQGSLNPNLADFGERSEARQYSGRHTEETWQCPFHRRP